LFPGPLNGGNEGADRQSFCMGTRLLVAVPADEAFSLLHKKRILLVLVIVNCDAKQSAHYVVISFNTWYITIVKFNFANKHLEILYTSGKSKKYHLEKQVLQGFFEVVAAIDAARDIHDLQMRPSLHLERLRGTEKRFSLRITRKYRLEVEIDWENEEKTMGIVEIEELSKHYE
jgi:proteic killer suppression protein